MRETLVKWILVSCHRSYYKIIPRSLRLVDTFKWKILPILMLELIVKVWILIDLIFWHYLSWLRLNLRCYFLRRRVLNVLKRLLQVDYFHLRSLLSHEFNLAGISFTIKIVHTGVYKLWSFCNEIRVSKLCSNGTRRKEISILIDFS